MTAEQRLAEAEARLEELEADRKRLDDIARHLVGVVELLAEAAGANVSDPYVQTDDGRRLGRTARPALRVLHGGAS